MNKRAFLLFPFMTLITACNLDNSRVSECRLVGNLNHVQYWNQNDEWDISSLKFELVYSNGKTVKRDITSNNSTFVFYPASPVGIEPTDNFSFKITECIYRENGRTFYLGERTFNGIKIIDYPYKTSITSASEKNEEKTPFLFILLSMLFIFVTTLFPFILHKKHRFRRHKL